MRQVGKFSRVGELPGEYFVASKKRYLESHSPFLILAAVLELRRAQ